MVNIFTYRCANPETLDYYYFADQPTQNNSPGCLYSKKSYTCGKGGAHLRSFVWDLLIKIKNNYLLKNC